MFTGIVDDVGIITGTSRSPAGLELRVRCRYQDLVPGESVALNGVCLTVRECGPGWFSVAAMEETLSRTVIGDWHADTRVNLERALRMADRLGGHLVQGHVDGVGVVRATTRRETALLVDIEVPDEVWPVVVPHGSICIDGVSLTVNDLLPPNIVQVALIEYTERHTTLGALAAGARVHIEADIIGKYVQRMMLPFRRVGG